MPGRITIKALTVPDSDYLRKNVRAHARRLQNAGRVIDPERKLNKYTERFIAKIPTGGIPARSGITLTPVECEVYQIVDDLDTLARVDEDNDYKEKVYNTYATAINETQGYVQITRDKFGNFIADPPLGGSSTGIKWINGSGVDFHVGAIMFPSESTTVDGEPKFVCSPVDGNFSRFFLINGEDATISAFGSSDYGHWAFDPSVLGGSGHNGGIYAALSKAEGYPPIVFDSWGPKPGSTLLHPVRPGFTIVDADTYYDMGDFLLVRVVQHQVNKVYGILRTDSPGNTNAIVQGGTGQLEIWVRDGQGLGKRKVAGWYYLTVRDSYLNKNQVIVKDSIAQAAFYDGYWELEGHGCDPDNTGDFDQSAAAMISSFGGAIPSGQSADMSALVSGGTGTGIGTTS